METPGDGGGYSRETPEKSFITEGGRTLVNSGKESTVVTTAKECVFPLKGRFLQSAHINRPAIILITHHRVLHPPENA